MKILHVTADMNSRSGIPTAMLDHIYALNEKGVEQIVACHFYADFLEPLREIGIPVKTFDFNKQSSPLTQVAVQSNARRIIEFCAKATKWFARRIIRRNVRRIIESNNPDIIHCWGEKAATFIPRRCRVPSLGWDVGFGNYDLKRDAVCDYYTGVNPEITEKIKEWIGRPDCVFLGHAFGALREEPPLSREEFGIPDGKPVILMLARMHRQKGVDILLRASVNLDAYLLLAGDGPEIEDYRALARDLGLESRVFFTGWRSERASLLELADILAVPSRQDPCPAVMSEAWQKGIPLVASNVNGLGDYIQHGVNGMSSDIDDVDGLARNLRTVLKDNDLRKRLIAGGTHTHNAEFSKEVVIDNLLKIYAEIIRRGVVKNK